MDEDKEEVKRKKKEDGIGFLGVNGNSLLRLRKLILSVSEKSLA